MPRKRVIKKEDADLVIGEIMGGLGNQLFIIFTTIAYSLKHKMNFSIINIERKRKSYFDNNIYKNLPLYPQINYDKIINKSNKLSNMKRYREPNFFYQEIPKLDKIILYGYYQSPKYFDDYKNIIIKELKLLDDREFLKYDGFLHFRIGDYKNIECHPVCDINYYIKCFEDIYKKDNKELNFVYYFEEENKLEVEDKVNILREKFKRFSFTKINTEMEDYKQMLSMTTMKYCVIANSSFSWWGAYLNDRKDKVIYLPKTWFVGSLGHYDTSELIMENWNKI